MASLATRVNGRGFASGVDAGMTGAGALESQGSTVDPAHGQAVDGTGRNTTLHGFEIEGPAAPDGVGILEGTWGLGGGVMTDETPSTHAAPVPGWAGSYDSPDLLTVHENSADIHSFDAGALTRHVHVNTGPEEVWDRWQSNESGETPLDPVTGQLRAMGGRDRIQGYNLSNRHGFDAGHRERVTANGAEHFMAYLDPAERVFVVPQASGSFSPTDAIQGPQPTGNFLDGGSINYTDPSPFEPAADPATLTAPQAGGTPSAGWW